MQSFTKLHMCLPNNPESNIWHIYKFLEVHAIIFNNIVVVLLVNNVFNLHLFQMNSVPMIRIVLQRPYSYINLPRRMFPLYLKFHNTSHKFLYFQHASLSMEIPVSFLPQHVHSNFQLEVNVRIQTHNSNKDKFKYILLANYHLSIVDFMNKLDEIDNEYNKALY